MNPMPMFWLFLRRKRWMTFDAKVICRNGISSNNHLILLEYINTRGQKGDRQLDVYQFSTDHHRLIYFPLAAPQANN